MTGTKHFINYSGLLFSNTGFPQNPLGLRHSIQYNKTFPCLLILSMMIDYKLGPLASYIILTLIIHIFIKLLLLLLPILIWWPCLCLVASFPGNFSEPVPS